jgi:hypothetical protein
MNPFLTKTKKPFDSTGLGIAVNTVKGIPKAFKELYKGEGQFSADKGLGIARNTVLGLPKAAKDVFLPQRGFTEEQLREAKPTFSQQAQGIPKVGAEIVTSLGELLNMIPGYSKNADKFTRNEIGDKMLDLGNRIRSYGVPQNAEEAQAMRLYGDIASNFIPFGGSIKTVGKADDVLKPLLTEAKKYKSAEEFVKANSLFHGTSKQAARAIKKEGFKLSSEHGGYANTVEEYISFTDKQDIAKMFADNSGYNVDRMPGGEIITIDKSKLKIADPEKIPQKDGESYVGWMDRLRKDGWDAVDLRKLNADFDEGEIGLLNLKSAKLLDAKAKQELKDVWEKAHFENIQGSKAKYDEEMRLTDIWKEANKSKTDVKKIATSINEENSAKYIQEVRAGLKEDMRLSNEKILNQVKDYGAIPSNATPKTTVKIYRAGEGAIKEGEFVTTVKEVADKYIAQKMGRQLFEKEVPVSSLVRTKGTGNEFIYSPQKLSTVDQAIADGRIRVVSRDGKDVYQVKKGDEWVSKRDEDSALKALEPKPKALSKVIQIPQELEERLIGAQIAKEELDANPLKKLSKYASKRGEFAGGLKEVTGKGDTKFGKRGDDIVHSEEFRAYGITDSEQARQAYTEYRARVEDNNAEIQDIREAIRQAKTEAKIAAKTTPLQPKVAPTPLSQEKVKSLEESALQTLNKVDEPYRREVSSLPEIIQKTQTDVKSKVNALDWVRTPDRVMAKIGFAKEAKMLRTGYDNYAKELPKNIEKITGWYKQVGKGSSEKIFQYLDGKDVALTPKELKVAGEMRAWLKEWAVRLKLPADKTITNYITHIFDEELLAKEFDEDLAKIIADKVPGQVYDPFLEKRLGKKGYKQDVFAALDAYTKRATRKANMDDALQAIQDKAGSSLEFTNLEASQYKYIQKYVHSINMRPTDIDNAIDNTVKSIVGYKFGQRPVTALTKTLRQITYRGMLGANLGSAMRNLSQGVNTYAKLGEKYTAIGYAKMLAPHSYKELAEQGLLKSGFIEDRALSSTKKLLEKIDKGLWLFFDSAEKINRGSAYFGAKSKGIAKGMSEADAIDYAKEIVRKTQFSYDPVDQPLLLSSDIAKTLGQFQTYTTKQTEFLVEMLQNREVAGIIRYTLGGLVFVYTIGKAFGMEPKELLPMFRFDTPPSLKFPVEVGKALLDTPNKYGQQRDMEQKLEDIGKSATGFIPAGAQIKKTIQGMEAVDQGESQDKAGRTQFGVGGTPAADWQAILFGKYANPNAKEYYNKKENPKKKSDNPFLK